MNLYYTTFVNFAQCSYHLQQVKLKIIGFRHAGQDGMIRRLLPGFDLTQRHTGILRGFPQHPAEHLIAHEMGTEIASPFMFLSFICLAAIPAYAITDCGFIDVAKQQVIDPILEVVE